MNIEKIRKKSLDALKQRKKSAREDREQDFQKELGRANKLWKKITGDRCLGCYVSNYHIVVDLGNCELWYDDGNHFNGRGCFILKKVDGKTISEISRITRERNENIAIDGMFISSMADLGKLFLALDKYKERMIE